MTAGMTHLPGLKGRVTVQPESTVSRTVLKAEGVTFNTPATPDQMFRDTFELTVAARNRLYGN